MKDTKVKRIRQKIAMLKRQFLQGGTGVFGQVLGDQEIAAVADELVEPHRERIYPPLDTLRITGDRPRIKTQIKGPCSI